VSHLKSCVIYEQIQFSKLPECTVDHRLTMLLVPQITGDLDGLAPCFLNPQGGFVRVLLLREICEKDVGALPCERERNRASDAAIGARKIAARSLSRPNP